MIYLKQYKNYQDYIDFQKKKSSNPKVINALKRKHEKRIKIFTQHFNNIHLPSGSKILCLGARTGEEVDAWNILGYDAIGVDIISHHPKVLVGDFHDLKWNDSSFDAVYSNSLDHSNNAEKFFSEAIRVLKQNGLLIIEIHPKMDGCYEIISIQSVDDIISFAPKSLKYIGVYEPKRLYKVKEFQLIWKKI